MTDSPSDLACASVENAIKRHGGGHAFKEIDSIAIRMNRLTGIIPVSKGLGRTFTMPDEITVYPNSHKTVFHYRDEPVVFDNRAIEASGKQTLRYRNTFAGFRKLRFWSNRDASYFFGYALTNYFSLPFSLAALDVPRTKTHRHGATSVDVIFPKDADTHSRLQRFWFDESGLLVRHDYRADILGPIFFGAHFSYDYRFDLPIPIAQHRVVKMRLGRFSTPIAVLNAQFTVESVRSVSATRH